MRIQYQHSANAKSGFSEKRRSIPKLIKLSIVEAAEFRRQAAQRPDQPELRGDEVNAKREPRLLRKREAMLGFALHLNQRVARGEEVRVQLIAAVGLHK